MKFWERFTKPQEEVKNKPEKPQEEIETDDAELDRKLDVIDENLEAMKQNKVIKVGEAERWQKQLKERRAFIDTKNEKERIELKNVELPQWWRIIHGREEKE